MKDQDYLSLTHPQRRIWYLEQMHPHTTIGLISVSIRLKSKHGPLHIPVLQQAINEVLRKNDAMRIRIVDIGEAEPKQYVADYEPYEVEVTELADDVIDDWIRERCHEPMPYLDTRMYHFSIIPVSDQECIILYRIHHLISDGLSSQQTIDDIVAYYSYLLQDVPLPEDRPSYLQFISNEHDYIQSDRYKKDQSYWIQQLEPDLLMQEPVAVNTRLEPQSIISNRLSHVLSSSAQQSIYQFCERYQISILTLFTALLAIYLYKWTSRNSLVLGTTLSNRTTSAEKRMLGMFVSIVPLRLEMEGTVDCLSVIKQVHKKQFSAARHQKYPFNQLMHDLRQLHHDGSRLFDIAVEYRDSNSFNREGNEHLEYQWEHIQNGYEENDCLFRIQHVTESNELAIHFDYRQDKYAADDMQQLLQVLLHVMDQVVHNPDMLVNDLELCSFEEREALCEANRLTKVNWSLDQNVVQLFEQQLLQSPDQLAVICGGDRITYQQLHARAHQLRSLLRSKGIGAEDVVAIMGYRSIDLIIGMLGTWMAGAAYMPVDPALPLDRIHYMLSDSDVSLVLTHRDAHQHMDLQVECVLLDELPEMMDDTEGYSERILPQHLAYIIYTSGSTGLPKGVMIEHGSLTNTLLSRRSYYSMQPGHSSLPIISYALDGFGSCCFTVLISGATLVLAQEEEMKDFEQLRRLITSEQVTHFMATPSLYGALLSGLQEADVRSLKAVTLVGERVSEEVIARSTALHPHTELIIEYGPSENSVVTTIRRHVLPGSGAYSIGKPIANNEVYILNEQLQMLPIGVLGELYVGGAGLARGYVKLPELTAERFIGNPYAGLANANRLYKTGDRARWLPNGEIEYIGRVDNQVKIRGYRIELGEIEVCLEQLPSVHEAAVLAIDQGQGGSVLYAYAVGDPDICIEGLKMQLKQQLPSYMIPAHIILLDKMPLTHNGKIDRRELLGLAGKIVEERAYIAPRTANEQLLVQLWEEILDVHPIGVDHNFWELGGDSIKALQFTARLHQYGLSLAIKDLYTYPTIRESSDSLLRIQRDAAQLPVTGEVLYTPIQHWFFEQRFINRDQWNQSFMLYSRSGMVPEYIKGVFDVLVKHHDALRMTYHQQGDSMIQRIRGVDEGPFYTLEVFELRGQSEIIPIIERTATTLQQSISMNGGPLIRLGLFRTDEGDHLLLTIHHIAVDGYSWRILFEDIRDGYTQQMNQRAISLKSKTDSLPAWTSYLAEYAHRKEVVDELAYWLQLEQVAGDPLPLQLASCDDLSSLNRWCDLSSVVVAWNEEESDMILRKVHQASHIDAYNVMLTAFGMSLAAWSGGSKFRVEVEGHGRESIDEGINVSRTVGWFTSIYPIVLEISSSESAREALERTERMLNEIPNNGFNYGVLRYLSDEKVRNGVQLKTKADVNFNYMGQFGREVSNEWFKLSSMPHGDTIGLDNKRAYLLEAIAMAANGQLTIRFVYSKHHFSVGAIQEFADIYREKIKQIVDCCMETKTAGIGDTGIPLITK